MIASAVLSAMVAALLVVPTSSRTLISRLNGSADASPARPGRRGLALVLLAGALCTVSAVILDGTRGLALMVSMALVSGTTLKVGRHRLAMRRASRVRTEVARASEVLASLVRIGQVPSAALALAARDCTVLAPAAAVQVVGGDPVAVLRRDSTLPGAGGLVAIARAWELSESTGAPIVASLEAVTQELRASRDLAHLVTTELAAPRATSQVLAALPFAGLGMGVMMGGDPIAFLTGSLVGQLCLVVGVLLASAGVLWSEALADRAAQSAGVT